MREKPLYIRIDAEFRALKTTRTLHEQRTPRVFESPPQANWKKNMNLNKPLDEFTAAEAVVLAIGTLLFLLTVPRIIGMLALVSA